MASTKPSSQRSLFDDSDLSTHSQARRDSESSMNPDQQQDLLTTILALSSIDGVGNKTLYALFDAGFLTNGFRLEGLDHSGLPTKLAARMSLEWQSKRDRLLDSAQKTGDQLARRAVRFVTIDSPIYPSSLRRLPNPPRWFFVRGDANTLKLPATVGIVGTRNSSSTGERLAHKFAAELVRRNAVIVSGLANGIDQSAHTGAVDNWGQTIAVLGYGILFSQSTRETTLSDRILEMEGAILSEYLPNDIPSRYGFLRRNELLAALSLVLVPVECPSLEKSGTGATIRRALSISTAVIGILPDGSSEPNLVLTKENLEKLNCPIFRIGNGYTIDLWKYLERAIPEHSWEIDVTQRQLRFFRSLADQILGAKDKLNLDVVAIDLLATFLKQTLT